MLKSIAKRFTRAIVLRWSLVSAQATGAEEPIASCNCDPANVENARSSLHLVGSLCGFQVGESVAVKGGDRPGGDID